MDQVQWAVKELTALREEHSKLGLRIQKLEQVLQSVEPSEESNHPSVPPLNTARMKEPQSSTTSQSQSQQKQKSAPVSSAAESASSPPLEGAQVQIEELTNPNLVEEICCNVRLIGALEVKVEIGLVAKSVAQMRHYREEPCVVLKVSNENAYWYIAKTFNQLKNLDTTVRTSQLPLPQLPTKDQWQSYSPVKIDVRIDLLSSYFLHMQELVPLMFPKSQAVYAQFLGTDIVQLNHDICCSFLVSRSRFSGWKPRFCVLNGNGLDLLDKPGGTCVQTINLSRAHISPITDNITGSDDEYRHGFTVVEPRENSSKTTTHFFSCESQAARSRWLSCLQGHGHQKQLHNMASALPFIAVRERPSMSDADVRSVQTDVQSLHVPSPVSREKARKRQSSLTLDFPPGSPFMDSGSPRISSPQSAIAITHPSSGPTSAFAAHRRVISPTAFSHSPLSSSGHHNGYNGGPNVRSNVFRVSLDDALGYSSVSIGNAVVPTIVGRCLDFLYSKNAYLEEGLFRISGTQSQVDSLEVRFERDDVDVDDLVRNSYDVHVVASVLKRYFRLLPEPLISSRDEHFWREVMAQDHEQRNRVLREVVLSIPSTSYDVLDVTTQFLGEVHQNSDVNKMTPQNLGIVFSPTLGIPGPVIIALIEDQSKIFAG